MARDPRITLVDTTIGVPVHVAHNVDQFVAQFGDLVYRQLPFAGATTLTRLAQESQVYVRDHLTDHFTIRNRRVPRGIVIERADKRDWPHSQAMVGTRDEFMALQALGGEKVGQGGHRIAKPSRIAQQLRGASGSVPLRLKPRKLRATIGGEGFMIGESIYAGGRLGRRLERKGVTNRNTFLRLYDLVERQKVQARWPFRQEVESVVQDRYDVIFQFEMLAALKSSRIRSGSFSSGQARGAYLSAVNDLIRQLSR